MADKKISALTSATTPLAGTEVLPIVQSSTTVKVSVANLTSGRFVNMDSATIGSTSSAAYGSKLRVDGGIETFSSQYNIASGSSTPYEFVNRSSGSGFDFYVNAAGKRSVRFLSAGDVSITDNLVVGTGGKGLADSAGDLKLAVTTTSVAASSVLSGGLTHRKGTYSAGATAPSVAGVSFLIIANSGATSITNFTNAVEGQMLLLKFNDANTTITRNNAYLAGGVNFTSAANATLLLLSDGTNWYEVCRSTTNA